MDSDLTEFLTVAEVAEALRTSERTVVRLLKSGKLPGIYLGTREGWRIRRADLRMWITNRPKERKERDDAQAPDDLWSPDDPTGADR